MKRLKKFKPAFWDHQDIPNPDPYTAFSFARKWKLIVLFTSFMAILPLFIMTFVDFNLTRQTIEDEVKISMLKVLNSAATSISFSQDFKKAALGYVVQFDSDANNDIFVVNKDGTLLSSSFYYGRANTPSVFDVSALKEKAGIAEVVTPSGDTVIIGHARIPNSFLILIQIRSKKWITNLWLNPRLKLVGYLVLSIIVILLSIMGMATYLVGRIHSADRKKTELLHHAEYKNKLASIGRLSSGVAHEINNPLAIINQKTGLIMDMFSSGKDFSSDERLIPLTNDVLDAVQRCGAITRRLLDFAQHTEPSIEIVNVEEVIEQMIAFLRKEAERQNIIISVDSKGSIPDFECDRGSLQQIFLNLFDNAFEAMENGGRLDIVVEFAQKETLTIIVSDTGTGIAIDDINKIFEPFYSSKTDHWGTGLGLSITYGLVKEIGGDIMVKSKIGKGSRFTLTLPLKIEAENGKK
ncbi:MAG: HAMP domain-containing histidine kinase [Desulfobacteraceae bacterium]|nr:HAMP domain-containing histidine kinase [Desulfobacteraceae bacterium]